MPCSRQILGKLPRIKDCLDFGNEGGDFGSKFGIIVGSVQKIQKLLANEVRWSRFSDRKVPLNKVELDLVNQGIITLSA
jgi:hypothetical protein